MHENQIEIAAFMLRRSFDTFLEHVEDLSLEEMLFVPTGGYRSVLGILKHAAAWGHVYRSFAYDRKPKNWASIDWPSGLRDSINTTEEYVRAIIEWTIQSKQQWIRNIKKTNLDQLGEMRPVHWGEERPLYQIIVMVAGHNYYHAGELNQSLSIRRGEAWEEGEEVEENLISTEGQRVIPPWQKEGS